MNVNKAIIVGRITNDLELKKTTSGNSVLSFSVATNKSWKNDKGEKQEKTEYHNVVVFGNRAETIKRYFVKGQEIYVEGELATRNWDDKDTGKKMYKTEINLFNFEFGAKPLGSANNQTAQATQTSDKSQDDTIEYPEEDINPEDIPF